jgi:signal transduction histidine kinase
MSVTASLTNRIFLASALLVIASISVAIYTVNASVAAQAEKDLQAGLDEAVALVREFTRTEAGDFVIKGRLIADLPVLKGAASTGHPPTVQPIAEDYQRGINADLFVVLDRGDQVLASAGRVRPDAVSLAGMLAACRGRASGDTYWPYPGGVLHAAAIPMEPGAAPLGTLVVGFSLDQSVADRLRALTNSEVAFVTSSRIVASTLDRSFDDAILSASAGGGVFSERLGDEEFVGRLSALGERGEPDEPQAIVLRSRTRHLQFLPLLRWQIALTGLAAVLVATGLGYAVARTVTRPLRALTATMHDIAETGDLRRAVPPPGRWDDEDARLLAATFGRLTGALARFQRDAAQRERLSSLGRLSATIAHEIRNPLMIIKSTVRALRRQATPEIADMAGSIDEEVQRLDRVVTDVLDFARPIRFDVAPADVGEICRSAARGMRAPSGRPGIALDLPEGALPIVTDAGRLHGVVVNLLANALAAAGDAHPGGAPPVTLSVRAAGGGGWRIEVIDRGAGIAAEDLPRVFEPFFTTRQTGSGLGLALARNIIEGLGGVIAIESTPGRGTTARVDLPPAPPPGQDPG